MRRSCNSTERGAAPEARGSGTMNPHGGAMR